MFCPLCKYEYRDGFIQCSDCYSSLVRTKQEADNEKVARAWKGADKDKLERVLSALHDAEIPLRFKERIKYRGTFQIFWFRFPIFRKRSSDYEYDVTVLARDLQRARRAMGGHPVSVESSERGDDLGTD